jgi:cytochrome c553
MARTEAGMKRPPGCHSGWHGATRAAWLGAALAAASPAWAADAAVGGAKANACAVCHGPTGLSVVPDAPNLAGQPALYLATQLRAYRSGKRVHEVMSLMAKPLSDADIENLAAWYSSFAIDVRKRE